MKTTLIITTTLFIVLAFTGCAPCRHYNRLQAAPLIDTRHVTRKPYGSVTQVWRSPSEIPGHYQVIGMLSCEGDIGEEAGILNAMLYRAADLGADGILLGGPRIAAEKTSTPDADDKSTTINVNGWAALTGSGNHRAFRCQVIRLTP
jgi:hypothetical protein